MSSQISNAEPLVRIAKREGATFPQKVLVRAVAILLAVVVDAFFIYFVTGLNPISVYRVMWNGTLMNTTRFAGDYGWTDFRLSANVAPTGWFSATAAFSEGSFGPAFGWLLNFHPKGFNFYIGMDHASFKVAKQGVPLGNQYDLNIGMNVSF